MNKILTNLFRLSVAACLLALPGWMGAQTFTSSPNASIGPNAGTVTTDVITVPNGALPGDGILNSDVVLWEVCLDLQHTFADDLDVTLTNPAGRTSTLFADDGGAGGLDSRADVCLSGTGGVAVDVDDWQSGNPERFNPMNPEQAIGSTCERYFGVESGEGDWTLEITDDAFGDAGTLFSWSIEFRATSCGIEGVEDVVYEAPLGLCTDIPVEVDQPTTTGRCAPIASGPTLTSGQVTYNNCPGSVTDTDYLIDASSVANTQPCADIEVCVNYNGDHDGGNEEFILRDPNNVTRIQEATSQCQDERSCFTVAQATWSSWLTDGDGTDVVFTFVDESGVNCICGAGAGGDFFEIFVTVPTDCSVFAFNTYNGTTDASDNYPIGTTCFNWCAVDAATGGDIVVEQCVTVLPQFNQCEDMTLHAGPGECEAVLVYDTTLSCPLGGGNEPLICPGLDTNGVSANSVSCIIPNTTHGMAWENPANYIVTGVRYLRSQFYGGGTNVTFRLYQLNDPNGDVNCNNFTLIDEVAYTPLPAGFGYMTVPLSTNGQKLDAGRIYFEVEYEAGFSFPTGMDVTTGGNCTYFGSTGNPAGCGDPCDPPLINQITPFPWDMLCYVQGFTEQEIEIIGPRPWEYVPIGDTSVCMFTVFPSGDSVICKFDVTVDEYPNPITALACNDDIQLSLDETCMATVGADMVLEGGPHGCYDDYIVTVEDDRGNRMDMDNDPSNGTQLGWPHIGRCFQVTVFDPETGNSCWGNICVEDKLPPVVIECANDTVDCETNTNPLCAGGGIPCPVVVDACDPILSASWVDWETDGSCESGYNKVISRRWTFTDDYGNTTTCEQTIVVELSTLFDVVVPSSYDDIANPALLCDEKIDRDKDVTPHIRDFPFCVDGYLLDSAIWFATGGNPNIQNPDARDLSGVRLPRTLGWNCLDSGPYVGHPSPTGVYYDPHPQWEFFGVCWGPEEIVQWEGTGLPLGTACFNIHYEYRDTRIDLYDPECDAGDVGCYKILRQWTVFDWCTGEVGGHNQIIKVLDKEGPEILAPDEIEVGTDPWFCLGRFDVPAPWIIDNCSNDVDYRVTTKYGNVFGNADQGYIVTDIPIGSWPLYIEAFDCCGNRTVDSIIMNVEDNTPPVCIAEDRVQLSLSGNQSPGTNFAAICAEDLNKASYDNCTEWLWYKMIRMDELLGTVNGSFADNTVGCGGINGDDDAIISGNQVYFDDCSKFCCDDADEIVMVVLRVHDVDPGAGPVNPARYTPPAGDLVGRFTDCWVEIDVRDKAQPIVVAPPDIVVSCMFWFDDSEDALSDPSNPTFGRVVTDLNDREKVKTLDIVCEEWCEDHPKYDYEPSRNTPVIWSTACDFYGRYYNPAHPGDKYELVWGFDGYVLRTCGATPEIRVDDRRECGQGVILRDVIVSYQDPKTGGVVTFRDRQEIWVIDCDPFYVNADDCFDDEDCIEWPLFCQQPDPLDGCGADLDPYNNPDLGFPVIVPGCDDNCALVAVDYEDEIYTIEPDACFKVIRTWTIIDWCQYDPLAGQERDGDNPNEVSPGRWEYVQSIVVRDKIDPEITVDVGDCEPAVYVDSLGTCVGHIDICASATDDCSPDDWIVYDYKVDAFSDGVGQFGDFDFYVGKLTLRQFNNGTVLTQGRLDCEQYNQSGYCNPFADDPTQPFCASGTYPVGTHTFYFFAEDGCGNVYKHTEVVEILDCKEPTPICKNGIITVVMPVNGEICIWASDLNDKSFDNCTAEEDLKFYFNGDPNMLEYCVNCDTFEARGADDKILIDVEVWVEDEEGNTDYCVTTIEIQDNNDVCEGPGSLAINGHVENVMTQERAEDVQVYVNGAMDQSSQLTNRSGVYKYEFTTPGDFVVAPYNDDDPLNGVSTADLVAIQRHLLGKEEFNSGYQLIAADVNNTQGVSAADMAALRSVILGRYNDFSKWNQTSWRFSDMNENLADNMNPWPFTEELDYQDVATSMYDINFNAIKIGDLNGDAISNGLTGNSTRGNGLVTLVAQDNDLVAGDTYTMEVTSDNFSEVSGYQFTMTFDAGVLNYTGVESGALTVNGSNVGTSKVADGMITMSWNDLAGNAVSVEDGEVLFSVTFDVVSNAKASEVINVNSLITKAEAYDADIQVKDLNLEFRNGGQVVEVFELYQNVPNPFEASTVIGYTLPSDMSAVLTVYDVSGKVLLVRDVDGKRGYNEELIRNTELNGAGVLYYQLDAADFTATKRMVLID
ncbi:MAG: cohesin domain-containing protein [Saprospiraceae bacterium]|nr:cohesin domain-containing protein [Saprospiraceae bacterium]